MESGCQTWQRHASGNSAKIETQEARRACRRKCEFVQLPIDGEAKFAKDLCQILLKLKLHVKRMLPTKLKEKDDCSFHSQLRL